MIKKFDQILKNKTIVVAEIGQAHEGSVNIAHSYIDACADAGADIIKFQTHYALEESTLDEPFRVKFSYNDKTRFDYWKRMEFSPKEWKSLSNHAKRRGILFMSSVFSERAFNVIKNLEYCAWKIPSGEITNYSLLDKIIKTQKPIIVSTGLSDLDEIKKITNYLKRKKAKYILLQCTSKYPTSLEEVGMNNMFLFKKFSNYVGLSDHSGTIFPSVYASANGASLVEIHVTFDKKMFGVDTPSSININDLKILTNFTKKFSILKNSDVNKNSNKKYKKIFSRSICVNRIIKKGEKIEAKDIILKKPGGGINPTSIKKVINKIAKKDISPLRILRLNDLL